MGIPKFFRWLSERYPLCSQLVGDGGVPPFDNLYLDMNGIVHTVSRSIAASGEPFTETDIFVAVFAYVRALYETIRPRSVFFLAIDGVAPRAKVNQQRARRYRSAHEAAAERAKEASRRGRARPQDATVFQAPGGQTVVVDASTAAAPDEPFDSNCITPGTRFMARLSAHMRFLLARQVSEDPAWQGVSVVFSGAEVPGEGEHKIMEYIRTAKARAGYDANTRHCVYGLDADLILLGLLSHDAHFALLREEVTFGRPRGPARAKTAEDTRFFLLHLSLMREYLALDFSVGGAEDAAHAERAIDDFILMMCLVGNDFLPGLPHFHLGEGVLDALFAAYKRVLPSFPPGTYLNDSGTASFARLGLLLDELVATVERPAMGLVGSDDVAEDAQDAGSYALLRSVLEDFLEDPGAYSWASPPGLADADVRMLHNVAFECRLLFEVSATEMAVELVKDDGCDDDPAFLAAVAGVRARLRALRPRDAPDAQLDAAHRAAKHEYYAAKLGPDYDAAALARAFLDGIHWTMRYYYAGVASWTWFYPAHYAPYASDVAAACRTYVPRPFVLGSPLTPLQQLMAVLPPASAALVPRALAPLILSPSSPLAEFYPARFATDANGKKAAWEAVVLIPFIDAGRLVAAMAPLEARLTDEERGRNVFGETVTYVLADTPSPLPSPAEDRELLPDIAACRARCVPYALPVLAPDERFVAALGRGAALGRHMALGFPSLATLNRPIRCELRAGVGLDVFGQPARGASLVLEVPPGADFGLRDVCGVGDVRAALRAPEARERLASWLLSRPAVYVEWPYLREARVERLTDAAHAYELQSGTLVTRPLRADERDAATQGVLRLAREYRRAHAVLLGETPLVVWARPFVGVEMRADGTLAQAFEPAPRPYPLQVVVASPRVGTDGALLVDERLSARQSAAQPQALFPAGTVALCALPGAHYGSLVRVESLEPTNGKQSPAATVGIVRIPPVKSARLDAAVAGDEDAAGWMPAGRVQRILGMSGSVLARLAGRLAVSVAGEAVPGAALGLGVRHDGRGAAALGLARRVSAHRRGSAAPSAAPVWEYAAATVHVLAQARDAFPGVFSRLEGAHGRDADGVALFGLDASLPDRALRTAAVNAAAPVQLAMRAGLASVCGPRGAVMAPTDGDYLLPATVASLESLLDAPEKPAGKAKPASTVDRVHESVSATESTKSLAVPASALLSAHTAPLRLLSHAQAFAVGDRVVAACPAFFGAPGTVVGVEYDAESPLRVGAPHGTAGTTAAHATPPARRVRVLLDARVPAASDLDGQCSEGRGLALAPAEVLNVSRPQPLPGTPGVAKAKPAVVKPKVAPAAPEGDGAWGSAAARPHKTAAHPAAAAAPRSAPAPDAKLASFVSGASSRRQTHSAQHSELADIVRAAPKTAPGAPRSRSTTAGDSRDGFVLDARPTPELYSAHAQPAIARIPIENLFGAMSVSSAASAGQKKTPSDIMTILKRAPGTPPAPPGSAFSAAPRASAAQPGSAPRAAKGTGGAPTGDSRPRGRPGGAREPEMEVGHIGVIVPVAEEPARANSHRGRPGGAREPEVQVARIGVIVAVAEEPAHTKGSGRRTAQTATRASNAAAQQGAHQNRTGDKQPQAPPSAQTKRRAAKIVVRKQTDAS